MQIEQEQMQIKQEELVEAVVRLNNTVEIQTEQISQLRKRKSENDVLTSIQKAEKRIIENLDNAVDSINSQERQFNQSAASWQKAAMRAEQENDSMSYASMTSQSQRNMHAELDELKGDETYFKNATANKTIYVGDQGLSPVKPNDEAQEEQKPQESKQDSSAELQDSSDEGVKDNKKYTRLRKTLTTTTETPISSKGKRKPKKNQTIKAYTTDRYPRRNQTE